MENDFLWCERYRPRTVADTILPDSLKKTFEKIVDSGDIPNMLFTGTSGLGKTTVARALCEQLGLDHILINGSDDRNIDVLRGKIKQFASSVSLSGGPKVVILDEADYLNSQSTQPALRGFIEEFSANCRFILTCNHKNRLIPALHSRCSVYEFNTTRKNMALLAAQFMKRLRSILEENNVEYDDQTIAQLIQRHAPDWRRILNECQRHSISGELSLEVLSRGDDGQYQKLIGFLKEKNFKNMRHWVADNVDVDPTAVFRGIYDNMDMTVDAGSIPQLVLILADYSYKDAFVADHELNLVACFTEVMANVEFK